MSLKFSRSKLLKLCHVSHNQLPSPLPLAPRELRNTRRLKLPQWRRAKESSRELISGLKISPPVFFPKRELLRFANNPLKKLVLIVDLLSIDVIS